MHIDIIIKIILIVILINQNSQNYKIYDKVNIQKKYTLSKEIIQKDYILDEFDFTDCYNFNLRANKAVDIIDNILIVESDDGWPSGGHYNSSLVGFDLHSENIIWELQFNYLNCIYTYDENFIIVFGIYEGTSIPKAVCLNLKTGEKIWETEIETGFNNGNRIMLEGNNIILFSDTRNDEFLYNVYYLSKDSGAILNEKNFIFDEIIYLKNNNFIIYNRESLILESYDIKKLELNWEIKNVLTLYSDENEIFIQENNNIKIIELEKEKTKEIIKIDLTNLNDYYFKKIENGFLLNPKNLSEQFGSIVYDLKNKKSYLFQEKIIYANLEKDYLLTLKENILSKYSIKNQKLNWKSDFLIYEENSLYSSNVNILDTKNSLILQFNIGVYELDLKKGILVNNYYYKNGYASLTYNTVNISKIKEYIFFPNDFCLKKISNAKYSL